MTNSTMIVAGVMSGTSADGINVALVEMVESRHSRSPSASRARSLSFPPVRLIAHAEYPYPSKVRTAILSAMNATEASVAKLSRLNFLLGELYSEAVLATQKRYRTKIDLVGCHGQTLYHQGEGLPFLGRKLSTTWQTGEASVVAARVRVPVVSDFRPADMAVGGKGAPLVPYLDYLWFRDPKIGRVVQNIGGIANLTALPGGASLHDVFAFDTGPGNMVIDAVTQELFARKFDRNGKIAASGDVLEPVILRILSRGFFQAKPPKTAGREEFGREFVAEFLRASEGARKQDIVATATALTARSIGNAVRRFVIPRCAARNCLGELIVSGGGARNSTLVAMLAQELAALGIVVRFSDEFGLPSQAKEAVAFAVLAYETWHRRPSNVPSATGAKHAAILGKISYA
jgi:anhydro-N-acetylmuramic acid kinase